MARSQYDPVMTRIESNITNKTFSNQKYRRHQSDPTDEISDYSKPVLVHTTPPISHSYSSLSRQHKGRIEAASTPCKPKMRTPLIRHKNYKTAEKHHPTVDTVVRYCQEGKIEKESNV